MYSYIRNQVTNHCPHCKLANFTISKSVDLMYTFPDDAPFYVIHMDIYSPGKNIAYDEIKSQYLLVIMDNMTGYTVAEPLSKLNAQTITMAYLKLMCTILGTSRMIVVDADSKLFWNFSLKYVNSSKYLYMHFHEKIIKQ